MFAKIDNFMKKLSSGSSFIAAIWIFFLMIDICVDVISRAVFNRPIVGTAELVQNSLAAVLFLMLPWATHLGQLVRSTMIADKLPEKGRKAILITAFCIGAIVFAGIVYSGWKPMIRATKIRDFQGEVFRVPIYPVWWCIIYGSILSCYQCVAKIIHLVMNTSEPDENLDDEGGVQI